MPQNAVLLQAILDQPDDDALRLVYADWLEEHGEQDRAELIRVQIALAAGGEDGGGEEALRAREARLLRDHGSAGRVALARPCSLTSTGTRPLMPRLPTPADPGCHAASRPLRASRA
jgi:uncharacterized protein (TIGR02996 family)